MGKKAIFGAVSAALFLSACSAEPDNSLIVGREGPGGEGETASTGRAAGTDGVSGNGAAGSAGTGENQQPLSVHVENIQGLAVEIVTVACPGDCVEVRAVAAGGNPPYAYQWEDGSTGAERTLCPDATSEYGVTATDTAIEGDEEFHYDGQSADATVTAEVLDCSDEGGVCGFEGDAAVPESGRYVGTFFCPTLSEPDGGVDGGVLDAGTDVIREQIEQGLLTRLPDGATGTSGAFTLEIDVDTTRSTQNGTFYLEWVLKVIGAVSEWEGSLDCATGELRASWSGAWGLPVASDPADPNSPMTVVATGTVDGSLTAAKVDGKAGTIAGSLYWFSPAFMSDKPSICDGAYFAERQP